MNQTIRNRFKSCTEMFPELANTENLYRYLDFIQIPELKEFIKKCFEESNYSFGDYENKICEVLLDNLISRSLLDDKLEKHQTFVDCLLTSVFLHNVYFDEKDILGTLFKAREKFTVIGESFEEPVPENILEVIFETIESQLGTATPIQKMIPSPSTPQDYFANSVWIVRNSYRWF